MFNKMNLFVDQRFYYGKPLFGIIRSHYLFLYIC